MKTAILSDIHSNLEALNAVLDDARMWGAKKILIAGDIVGYGASANECISIIADSGADSVAGNHDWGVIEKTSIEYFNSAAQSAVIWTRKILLHSSRSFLEALPLTKICEGIALAHANFVRPAGWEYVFTIFQAGKQFEALPSNLGVIGHSHQPFIVRRCGEEGVPEQIESNEIHWDDDSWLLVNVGSVGQPRDGDPRACYLRVNYEDKVVTLARVPYDISTAQKKILDAGLPSSLATRLSYGR